ncbi:MAG: phosphonate C-P lyase system protein PhnH [Mangrovicoccus sp.]
MVATAPSPSAEERRANAGFEALLWGFARPGRICQLPANGEDSLIEALIDRECSVYCADPLLMAKIMHQGAQICDPAQADHLFLGALSDLDILRQLRLGSDLYPDEGATVILRAGFGSGPLLRLTGPGVDGAVEIAVAGLPDGFWSLRAAMIRYPMGFELVLLDGDRLIALPRSTQVEML